jgi:hypothetical protein
MSRKNASLFTVLFMFLVSTLAAASGSPTNRSAGRVIGVGDIILTWTGDHTYRTTDQTWSCTFNIVRLGPNGRVAETHEEQLSGTVLFQRQQATERCEQIRQRYVLDMDPRNPQRGSSTSTEPAANIAESLGRKTVAVSHCPSAADQSGDAMSCRWLEFSHQDRSRTAGTLTR